MNDEHQRLSARITGRVQGVGFRHYIRRHAQRLNVYGWVRNEADGSVRLEAEGPRPALQQLLEALRKGPPGARVDRVSADWSDGSGEFGSFSVRYW